MVLALGQTLFLLVTHYNVWCRLLLSHSPGREGDCVSNYESLHGQLFGYAPIWLIICSHSTKDSTLSVSLSCSSQQSVSPLKVAQLSHVGGVSFMHHKYSHCLQLCPLA